MKRIAIITATRAEFGLLMPILKKIRRYEDNFFRADLIVTGTHLSENFGYTIQEIENMDIRIDHRIKISVNADAVTDISNNQADALVKFTSFFHREKYNAIMILGDRYEMLAIAIAAGNTHTPIFHLCGGDTTEGAMDEWIRHSISKMSYLHFATNEESRKRIIQMGEDPDRVFNYGSTSIDNIMMDASMKKCEVLNSLGLKDCKYALCTYHPATMDNESVEWLMDNLLSAIQAFPDIQFLVTKSNADQGGGLINNILDKADDMIGNLHVFSSLGVIRYLSLMKYAEFVLGNSSSGMIEAPAFKIPTINIGNRQRGRLGAESIIHCKVDKKSIIRAIDKAILDDFKEKCKNVVSPYGDGNASARIVDKVISVVRESEIDLKKKFYIVR